MSDPPAPVISESSGKGGKKGKGGKSGKGGKGGKKGGKSKGECFKCGGTGHMAKDCSEAERKPREDRGGKGRKNNKECFKCGKEGHISRDCREDASGSEDEAAPAPRNLRKQQQTRAPARERHVEVDTSQHTELAAESINGLVSGNYECLICFSGIRSREPTWSCKKCFKIFHLTCTKKWGRSGAGGFRCPQCSEVYPSVPNKYLCFCGKVREPVDDGYSTPHSCGDPCNKTRGVNCPHKCSELCHPGPCPPCGEKGPLKTCHCGNTEYTLQCGEDDPGKSCGETCNKLLNCGKHRCTEVCHSGACSPCGVSNVQACYCGGKKENKPCEGQEEVLIDGIPRTFSCFEKCTKLRDCGKHNCGKECHYGECLPCELSPEDVTTCPCGKKSLFLLTKNKRTECTDTVATCTSQCGKRETCEAHACQSKCHEGPCPPCKAQVSVQCRCKATSVRMQCSVVTGLVNGNKKESQKWPPHCSRRCGAMKSCGRHKCSEVCCGTAKGHPGANHYCMEVCRRKLDCGRHNCEERCHPGACAPCRHIVVDEMKCRCGAEVLEPPQPCGTEPPRCAKKCSLGRECGHDTVPHECHYGDCPLCTERTEKECAGGHVKVVVPCHVQAPTCPATCEKMLVCGLHKCKKRCHAGACPVQKKKKNDDSEEVVSCGGQCGEKLPCDHPCTLDCHPTGTLHSKTCKAKVPVKCTCGRINSTMPCNKYYAEMRSMAGKKGGIGMMKPTLPCDDECDRVSRLDGMREAFGIDKARDPQLAFNDNLTPLTSVVYTHNLWLAQQQHPSFIRSVERTFHDYIVSVNQKHMMQPMNEEKRRLVIELGYYYNITVVMVDREPNRTCELSKNPNTLTPKPLLSEWEKDPLEMAQEQATSNPDAVIIFTDMPASQEPDFAKILKAYIGRWIGFRKDSKEYCIAFTNSLDCKAAASYLTKEKYNLKNKEFKLFSEYLMGDQGGAEAPGTRVVQGGSRRRQQLSGAGGPPPTSTSASGASVWQSFMSQQNPGGTQDHIPPPVKFSENKWASLGGRK
eukprot:TRINITY_DN9035_c0_g1_i1.p1 TRINITY_DN9035_c0_g1~~TRINITY_DN9035_c0_g1_i1.p1  ORF type:complete len:1055 (+),score=231.61 TRINITY_DN9035_c0_g1_i1:86-3166(+)